MLRGSLASFLLMAPAVPLARGMPVVGDDEAVLASLDAIERAASIAYTAEAIRDERDLPTGRTKHSSVRGQVWLEQIPVVDAAAAPALRWKIALSTVLEAPAAQFEGAFAYWAYDARTLRMLHPEQRRADVRDPTPANLSILTGFFRSKVLAPGIVDPDRARAAVTAATHVESLGTRQVGGVACRGFRLHYADDPDRALSDDWNEWWIGPDALPRSVSTNFVIAGAHVLESLRLCEVRVDEEIPAFVFAPEIPSTFDVPAQRSPSDEAAAVPVDLESLAVRGPAVGDPAPPIELEDGDGRPHSLAARKGSVTVLDFWGTWCAPCRIALPHLDALAREHADRGLEVWAMSCQERDGGDPRSYAASRGFALTVLPDADEVATRYAVGAFPTTLVVARDGSIAFVASGYSPDGVAQLDRAVEAALDAGP
ncbi:MAG: TlpA family protein disulfide reductase [Planctomycetes bacterium]|nr:TlpA family protein disulfide reductase [Planctomycetota bacterium]